MLNFCLPTNLVNEFLARVKSGEINPERLIEMGSQGRREYFASFLGDLNAHKVNAMFEEKILLKNQQAGLIKWAKQLVGINKQKERAFINKVNNMKDVLQPKEVDDYLEDLVSQRLGLSISREEAKVLVDLSQEVAYRKSLITDDMADNSQEALNYGLASRRFTKTVENMKREANLMTIGEFVRSPGAWVDAVAGTAKSLLSSFDNSFFGRQGFVTLANEPKIWVKNFIKSWGDIGVELQGKDFDGLDQQDLIKASVIARKNARNGKYKALNIDIGMKEEAFPVSFQEKIPGIGRLFKASETAFVGGGIRFRADLADLYIEQVESMGVTDLKNSGLGILINSMTGRGHLNITPGQSRFINVTMFSGKFLKSQLDLLSFYQLDTKMDPKLRKFAAMKAFKPIALIAFTLILAKLLNPDSVEEDSTSSDFGSIKFQVGKDTYKLNISQGLGALITIAARISKHQIKTSRGRIVKIGTGKYGNPGWEELFMDFFKGKTSPLLRNISDWWYGEHFGGEKVTAASLVKNMTVPIPAQNLAQMIESTAEGDQVLGAILSALDFGGIPSSKKQKRR